MQVVLLRRLGKRLGCEKIILKQGIMNMQFVSNNDSPYYRSSTFGQIINYVTMNVRRCELRETRGKRLMHVKEVASVTDAVAILKAIVAMKSA